MAYEARAAFITMGFAGSCMVALGCVLAGGADDSGSCESLVDATSEATPRTIEIVNETAEPLLLRQACAGGHLEVSSDEGWSSVLRSCYGTCQSGGGVDCIGACDYGSFVYVAPGGRTIASWYGRLYEVVTPPPECSDAPAPGECQVERRPEGGTLTATVSAATVAACHAAVEGDSPSETDALERCVCTPNEDGWCAIAGDGASNRPAEATLEAAQVFEADESKPVIVTFR